MRSRRDAFTLIECLIALTLVAAVGVIAGRMFPMTVRVMQHAQRAHNQINSGESALRQLRVDVLNASAIRSDTPSSVFLDQPGGSTIVWTQLSDKLLLADGSGERRWEHLAEPLHFEARKARLIVGTDSDDQLILVSQPLLIQSLVSR